MKEADEQEKEMRFYLFYFLCDSSVDDVWGLLEVQRENLDRKLQACLTSWQITI